MLRSTWCVAILAAGLVMVVGLTVSEASSWKGRKPSRAPAAPAVQYAEDVVDGYGPTTRDARARALEHAQERVADLLRQEAGDPNWSPPADLLELETLDRYRVIAEMGKPEPTPDAGDDKALVARYKVQLTDDYLRAVQKEARQERVRDRHLLLGRVLGGLVVVFLVTAGYLRLEEMTRGYATQLLRLAACAILALAGFTIWLTM